MLTSAIFLLASGVINPVAVTVNLQNFKDGELITSERSLRVTVQASSPIRSVEFYVGSELRDTDTSTPYEFKIDPLNEKDGDMEVTFAAYTTDGETGKKTVTLKIDTGVSKGAPFHVEAGEKALVDQKWDDAIYSGRVALKAKPGDKGARMLLAKAYLGKGQFDRAQAFAEEVIADDPSNTDAKALLSGISLRKAFLLSNTDRATMLKTISTSVKQAATLARQNLDDSYEKLGEPNEGNIIKWADVALRAGKTKAAVKTIEKYFTKKQDSSALGNRLAYAQIREFDIEGAAYTLNRMIKEEVADAYTYSLAGVVAAMKEDRETSDKMIAEAEAYDSRNVGLRTAKAYIALRRGRVDLLEQIVVNLVDQLNMRSDVNYYRNVLQNHLNNYSDADKAFQTAVLANPAFVDMYLEKGNQSLKFMLDPRLQDDNQKKYQSELAEAYYKAAMEAQYDSAAALTAIALHFASSGNMAEAMKSIDGATRANNKYTPAFYAATAIYLQASKDALGNASRLRKEYGARATAAQKDEIARLEQVSKDLDRKADETRKIALDLDKKQMQSRSFATILDAFNYMSQYGRVPVLALPE